MTVQYSIQKLVSDGSLSTVVLGIQYLERNDIYMRIGGEDITPSGSSTGYTWYFVDNTTLKINPVVPVGVEVHIYRRTDTSNMYNIYSQNAQFDESTVDENNQQLLFIAQEYLEQGIPGAGVQEVVYISETPTEYLYRIRLTDGGLTPEFSIPKQNTDILGYNYLGPYAAGLVLTTPRDTISKAGRLYSRDGTYPYTLTGDFVTDGPWIALSTSTGIYLHTFTATAGQTEFTLAHAITPGTIPLVFLRGVYQQYNVAYTVDTSNSRIIRFTTGLMLGDTIQVAAMSGADVVAKGDRPVLVFKNATSTPATPVGYPPVGWTLYPSTPSTGEFTYISTGVLSGEYGTLLGSWSTPSRLSGEAGAAGVNGSTGAAGADVQSIELVSKVGKIATYRFLLSDATYTNTFQVLDGLDGTGSVSSVNSVLPDLAGNVQLTPANIGASTTWVNDTANTGTLNTSSRVRWLVDTSAARGRAIGTSVTELVVKDTTGLAGTNNITITAPSGKTVNGATTETIDVNYGWVHYVLIGTDFKTIGGQ